MQEEETYTSLQWDNPSPNLCQDRLISTKSSGVYWLVVAISFVFWVGSLMASIFLGFVWFQVSAIVSEQQEKLIQHEKELQNFTQWRKNHERQMTNCQTFVQSTISPAFNHSPCPDTWIHNRESCYRVFEKHQEWNSSKEECQKMGSELLQIENKKEMDFVTGRLKIRSDLDYWVGLFQNELNQTWVWLDGSSPSPDLLPERKPQSADQVCGYLKGKLLLFSKCTSIWKYFVCEKKYAPRPGV
ncbi:C-type lectin domain family 9 member A [Talpa occidentalis]|uniref:C-type lectin domain family 9 member A n=1 Tax=Talpa occidentalis TaxID=50954 RepID=UPI00188FC122|nr:C-type lectin domain family 9 member A [Talpa occidentalis]